MLNNLQYHLHTGNCIYTRVILNYLFMRYLQELQEILSRSFP